MNQSSTFRFNVMIPRSVRVEGREMDRDTFYSWAWERLAAMGLAGIHEGTLLSQDASEKGLETESWTLDAAEAPRERDWVADQAESDAEFYFESMVGAERAVEVLRSECGLTAGKIQEQKPQDWDAEWKASFTGATIPPCWRVLPPWMDAAEAGLQPGEVVLRINPGAGFGTGTHETTQLCLQAIAETSLKRTLKVERVLDFGSGSGILAIGAALFGARVDAVEIDPLAIDNALENARLNGVETSIQYSRALSGATDGPYRLVIANILRPVLLEFAEKLVTRLDRKGTVILSGLIEKDLEQVIAAYSPLIGAGDPRVLQLNEWRALVWNRS